MRRRNFPKGYAEIPEKQHNQLIGSLTEMYRGFQRASLCSDEISGRLLPMLFWPCLICLIFKQTTPTQDSSSSRDQNLDWKCQVPTTTTTTTMRRHPQTPVKKPRSQRHTIEPFSLTPTAKYKLQHADAQAKTYHPQLPGPTNFLANPDSINIATPPSHILLALRSEPDLLRDDPMYAYSAAREALSSTSSFYRTNWYLSPPTMPMLPPPTNQAPAGGGLALRADEISAQEKAAFASRPALCHNWLGNGISFDGSDLMGDLHQSNSQDATPALTCSRLVTGIMA